MLGPVSLEDSVEGAAKGKQREGLSWELVHYPMSQNVGVKGTIIPVVRTTLSSPECGLQTLPCVQRRGSADFL